MTLSLGYSPFLLLPALLLAAGLAYWVYRGTVPALPAGKKFALRALRFLALALTLFLLFDPILQRFRDIEHSPILAVLVDGSESLSLQGEHPDGSTFNVEEEVRDALSGFQMNQVPGEVRFFSFGRDVKPHEAPGEDFLDSLQFSSERTNIAQAIATVQDNLRDENLQAMLLISDGRYNTGRNPLFRAERSALPIHTAMVGDTTEQRDLQIRTIRTNELAYLGMALPIQVVLRSEDFPDQRVSVSLFDEGQLQQTVTADLPAGVGEVQVEMEHTPSEAGLRRYTVSVTRLDGETTYRNNVESVTVRVLESRRQILLVSSAPEPDLTALRKLLAQDDRLEVSVFAQKNRSSFYTEPFPDSLDRFDAVIMQGFPGLGAPRAAVASLADAIENGLPALFILSRQTDLRTLQRSFGNALPVLPRVLRANFTETTMIPSPQGLQHPIFEIADVPDQSWRMLPPLIFNDSRWEANPGAIVLATHEIRGVALSDPLLVIQNHPDRRAAALLGSGIWRWTNLPQDLEQAAPFWPALLSNLLQWVSTKEDDRPVRVAPIETLFSGEDPVQFTGQVYDESLNPVDDATLELEVVTEEQDRFPFSMTSIGNGRYETTAGALPPGSYRFVARATRNGVPLGEDQGSFAVGNLTLEFKETRADADLMQQIATRSGGNFFHAQRLNEVPNMLRNAPAFTPSVVEERQEQKQRHLPAYFFVVLGLLTVEWFIRKRSGMV